MVNTMRAASPVSGLYQRGRPESFIVFRSSAVASATHVVAEATACLYVSQIKYVASGQRWHIAGRASRPDCARITFTPMVRREDEKCRRHRHETTARPRRIFSLHDLADRRTPLFLVLLALALRLVVAMGSRAMLLLVRGAHVVVAGAPLLKVGHDLLQVIVDSIVIQRLALAQQMTQHHHLRDGDLARPLRLGALEKLLDHGDGVLACTVLLKPVSNRLQLLVRVHVWLPSGRRGACDTPNGALRAAGCRPRRPAIRRSPLPTQCIIRRHP